ncbi:aldehyde dehydrogenase family protein [Actinacidiphila sp. bgisy160]|uniref:aldehyde dehydrogenase family protein n=1 Tax=Actinacidiphila sp. bgisy160 TaxID=3413796 RepID=UPI003D7273BA
MHEAVRLADDSARDLAGTAWTADPEPGTRVARRIRSGTAWTNGYVPDIASPYGDVQAGGPGREPAAEVLQASQQSRSVHQR